MAAAPVAQPLSEAGGHVDTVAAVAPWLAHAFALLGVKEHTGDETEPLIAALFRDAGHADIRDDETAWCAAFVGACLARAAFQSTGSLAARSFLTLGQSINADQIGAIAIFKRSNNPALGHVGFIVGATPSTLFILGGNQSDAVSIAAFSRADLLDRRWPSPKQTTGASMPTDVFKPALAHVLDMEGGYSDDPFDPGGPTKYGITLATYVTFLGIAPDQLQDLTRRDDLIRRLRVLTPKDVEPIYQRFYWQPSHASELPPALALFHFDTSVNHGVRRAAELLQAALGVSIDGDIGPFTLEAAHARPVRETLNSYADVRRQRYRALPHFWRFGRGWLNRVDKTLAASLSLASLPQQNKKKTKTMRDIETPQPTSETADQPDAKWWGHSMTIWGTILTGLSTVLPVLGPLFGLELSPEIIQKLGVELTRALQAIGGVIGLVLTIIGRARATSPLMRRDMQIRF